MSYMHFTYLPTYRTNASVEVLFPFLTFMVVSKVHVRQDRTLTVQSFRDLHQYHAGHLLHGQRGGGSLSIDGC